LRFMVLEIPNGCLVDSINLKAEMHRDRRQSAKLPVSNQPLYKIIKVIAVGGGGASFQSFFS
jgi:hypothetical protein